jgi:hypothetical protein
MDGNHLYKFKVVRNMELLIYPLKLNQFYELIRIFFIDDHDIVSYHKIQWFLSVLKQLRAYDLRIK